MLKSANVAIPPDAACVDMPESVPPPGLAPSATVTPCVASVTRLPNPSRISTWTAGEMAAPAATLLGCATKRSPLAVAGATVTIAVCVMLVPPTVAEMVFASAFVEARVPVATPFASVAAGGVSVLSLPVAASTTGFPGIGLPKPSSAVTVMVDALVPSEAGIVPGVALTLVFDALTAPGRAVARKFRGLATPVAWTAWVLSAPVRVPSVHCVDATPFAAVSDVSGVTEPPPSITLQVIVTLATGLLKSSVTFTANEAGSVAPTVSFCRSPPALVIFEAPPTVAVMVKVTVVGVPLRVAVAVVVWVPGVTPSVRVVVAWPLTSVEDEVGLTEPPPDAAAQSTRTPDTGLPFASVTRTSCGVPSVMPACPVRLSPERLVIDAAAPTVALAVNITGLPASPGAVAVRVFAPAVGPRVHDPTAAMPSAPVTSGVVGSTDPSPDATAKVTDTPATGFPLASFTITAGGIATAVPAAADWLSPARTAICVAGPAWSCSVTDVALLSPVAWKLNVRGPAVPVIARLVKAAVPFAFVSTTPVPPSAPPPEAIAALTAVPLVSTALPAASWIWITGCCGNGTPLCGAADGWVTIASRLAGPAESAMTPEPTGASPDAEKRSV